MCRGKTLVLSDNSVYVYEQLNGINEMSCRDKYLTSIFTLVVHLVH